MTVSIVIPTLNRPFTLADTLDTVFAQTLTPDQVVVVDQSAADDTRRVVAERMASRKAAGKQKPELTYVYSPGLVGAGAARNIAIDHATGDVLVFLDDDVLLEEDFVRELVAVYEKYPGAGGVSGVITNYMRPAWRDRALDELFCRGPFRDERRYFYWDADRLRDSAPARIRKFGAGVSSLRRVALDGERFDDEYRGAGPEDVDLSWRVSERWPLLITARARLVHIRTESGRQRDNWLADTARQQHYLYYRLWNAGIFNRLCFAWLNCGFVLLATVSCLRRRSLAPWRLLLSGVRRGNDAVGYRQDAQRTRT